MSKITKEQIAQWKSEYGDIYELSGKDGKSCVIYDPTARLNTMKMVAACYEKGSATAVTEAIINNCFLGGDEDFKTNEGYLNEIDEQIEELLDIPDSQVDNQADHAVIKTSAFAFRVRYPSRADLKTAERRNKKGKPFESQIYLLEDLAIDATSELKKNNRHYFAVLLALSEVKRSKYTKVKKL